MKRITLAMLLIIAPMSVPVARAQDPVPPPRARTPRPERESRPAIAPVAPRALHPEFDRIDIEEARVAREAARIDMQQMRELDRVDRESLRAMADFAPRAA